MKNLDTDTVLEIIKMLDERIKTAQSDWYNYQYLDAYEAFRDHLQSFIEGELNAVENQTEQ